MRLSSVRLALMITFVYVLVFAVWLAGAYILVKQKLPEVSRFWQANVPLVMVFAVSSGLLIYFLVHRALTARDQTQQALLESEARYRYLFENSPISLWEEDFSGIKTRLEKLRAEGVQDLEAYLTQHPDFVWRCASQLRVLDVNRATLELYRARSKEQLLGNIVHILGSEGMQIVREELLAIWDGADEFESTGVNYRLDGKRIEFQLRWSVVPGYEDSMARVVVSILDITEQRAAEALQRIAEEQYRLLVEQVSAVVYADRVDAHSSNIYSSPYIEQLTGYTAEEWRSIPDLWERVIHPQDRERVLAEHERTNRTGEPFQMEYRIIRKDGRVIWVRDVAALGWDPHFQSTVWRGVLLDITETKQAEEALRRSEERLRALLEGQGEGTLLVSLSGQFVFANPAAEALFGVSPGVLLSCDMKDFTSTRELNQLVTEVLRCGRGASITRELPIRTVQGEKRILLCTLTPWYEAHGQLSGMLMVCRDVTRLKQLEGELRYQSTHDALTGLYNRRYFEEQLEQVIKQHNLPISLVMCDIDNMKQTNDRYGHLAGDELLRQAAQGLRHACRDRDVIARVGGDEFAILLPFTDQAAAEKVVGRLCEMLPQMSILDGKVTLSMSLGTASAEHVDMLADLFKRADEAMYADKARRLSARERSARHNARTIPVKYDNSEGISRVNE